MFLSMPNAYCISGFAMAIWRVFKMKLNYKFVQSFPKKFSKKQAIYFLLFPNLKKTILHKVWHLFKRFESGLSYKQQESTIRPKIVSIAESFIWVNLKDLLFPLSTKEWLSFFMECFSTNVIFYLCYFMIYYKSNLFIHFTQLH